MDNNKMKREELFDKLMKATREGLLVVSPEIYSSLALGILTENEVSYLNKVYGDEMKIINGEVVDNSLDIQCTAPVSQIGNTELSLKVKWDDMLRSLFLVIGGCNHNVINNYKYTILNWIYFHGNIETKLGYDIVIINRDVEIEDIIERDCVPVKVIDSYTRNIYDAIGFFWKSKDGLDRGLIVEANDYESIKYAVEMKEKQSSIL